MNTARPILTDQELLDRITSQSWLPDGDFTECLPYSLMHTLIMEFPKMSHDARDLVGLALMNNREQLSSSFCHRLIDIEKASEQVQHLLDSLEILTGLTKEAAKRLGALTHHLDHLRNSYKQSEWGERQTRAGEQQG